MINYFKNLFSKNLNDQSKFIYINIGKISLWLSPILAVIFSTIYTFNSISIFRTLSLVFAAVFIVLFLISLFFALIYKGKDGNKN